VHYFDERSTDILKTTAVSCFTQNRHENEGKANPLDGNDPFSGGVSRSVNLYLSRRYVTDCIDVATTTTNNTADSVCRYQQSL